jgi:hypothetical protein
MDSTYGLAEIRASGKRNLGRRNYMKFKARMGQNFLSME